MKASLALLVLWWPVLCFSDPFEEWAESSANPQELEQRLNEYREQPLNLNDCTAEALALLPFFDTDAAKLVIEFRSRMGGFGTIDDALLIAQLSSGQRFSIRECTKIVMPERRMGREIATARWQVSSRDEQMGGTDLGDWSSRGRVLSKWRDGEGFALADHGAGDPELFGNTTAGIGLHFNRPGLQLVLGDFQYEFGTGLVFGTSYGTASWLSSPEVSAPAHSAGVIVRPTTDRLARYRLGAADFNWRFAHASVLGSITQLDGAVSNSGALRITEGESYSTAQLGAARRNQIEERLAGVGVEARHRSVGAGLTGYAAEYSPEFGEESPDEETRRLNGSRLRVGSAFLRAKYGAAEVAAEAAISNPGGQAAQGALVWNNEPIAMTVYRVFADADFFSPHSRLWGGWGADAANADITGIRVGYEQSQNQVLLSAAVGRTPYRTSQSPLRKETSEVEARWTSNRWELAQFLVLIGGNWREETSDLEPSDQITLYRMRGDVTLRTRDEFRMRYEIRSASSSTRGGHRTGTLLFVQAKTRLHSIRACARLTLFHLPDDDLSTSVYESGLPGSVPTVPLSGTGRRASIVFSKSWRWITAGIKLAHMYRDAVSGRQDSFEAAMQCGYRWRADD